MMLYVDEKSLQITDEQGSIQSVLKSSTLYRLYREMQREFICEYVDEFLEEHKITLADNIKADLMEKLVEDTPNLVTEESILSVLIDRRCINDCC